MKLSSQISLLLLSIALFFPTKTNSAFFIKKTNSFYEQTHAISFAIERKQKLVHLSARPNKEKGINTGVFSLLLGGLGLLRFYLGYRITAKLQLAAYFHWMVGGFFYFLPLLVWGHLPSV